MINASEIRKYAAEAGFDLCGIARVRRLGDQTQRLCDWLGMGYDSGLSYMRRNIEKRLDPALLYEGAKTVIVCAANYKNEHWDQRNSRNPRISSYALAQDYHVTMKAKLDIILRRLSDEHPGIRGRCFTDSAPVLEKSWAIEAGLGWRGKNSLIVTPRHGSFVFLGEIIVDAETDIYDSPFTKDGCGTCTACIDACPNSAIVSPYVIDTNRCISRLTAEKITDEAMSSPETHGWIYGCDICQSVCPHNKRTPLSAHPESRPLFDPTSADQTFWDKFDADDFHEIFGTTPITRIGFDATKERAVNFFEELQKEEQQ